MVIFTYGRKLWRGLPGRNLAGFSRFLCAEEGRAWKQAALSRAALFLVFILDLRCFWGNNRSRRRRCVVEADKNLVGCVFNPGSGLVQLTRSL
jgi:hypothetical protein